MRETGETAGTYSEGDQREALYFFQSALRQVRPITVRLGVNDILALNNNFMVHGRTEFTGDRLLRRYLLCEIAG